jgi:hypothetical protein
LGLSTRRDIWRLTSVQLRKKCFRNGVMKREVTKFKDIIGVAFIRCKGIEFLVTQ